MIERNRTLDTATESMLTAVRAMVRTVQALAPSGRRRLTLELSVAVNRALADLALDTPDDFPIAHAREPEIPWDLWYYVSADPGA
ncbi:hypothetical protein ACQP1G_07865 [Nocardia sp. CA-107356]|uniref:hypothetical protein n=1 Tax=Nocardia sp. CA-107356 TaxID=3239972 RepID=UPI003D936D48